MNILLVTSEFPPFKGGVANYYGNLVDSWPRPNSLTVPDSLTVLHNNKKELISASHFWPWRRAFRAIKKEIKKAAIGYILVGQVLPLGTVVWILSFCRTLKYAVFFHGMDLSYSRQRLHKRLLTGLIIKRADKIICANSYVKSQIDKYYPVGSAKAIIANPGIPAEVPRPKEGILDHLKTIYGLGKNNNQVILFTLGRLVKRKGVDKVISALKAIPEELLTGLKYFVAGVGPDEEYLKALVPDKLKDRVVFLGELNEDEKWAWLNLCDIFIMPARNIEGDFEGFGIVYLEANLCGKPVIAGLSGGVRDAVEPNYNGLMVDPEDENSIRDAITRLINDSELRAKLGRQGQARTLNEFSWPAQAISLNKQLKNNTL